MMKCQFLCFAPISHVSPENWSKFGPIYHVFSCAYLRFHAHALIGLERVVFEGLDGQGSCPLITERCHCIRLGWERKPIFSRLNGEETSQKHLDESLAGIWEG